MAQSDLFDPDGQAAHLARVSAKIADAVLAFCRARLAAGRPEFHADDLLSFVGCRVQGLAPDSPSRVLRMLRREGLLDYAVLSRKDSLYRVSRVADFFRKNGAGGLDSGN